MAEDIKKTDAEIKEYKQILDTVREIQEDVKSSSLDKERASKMETRLDTLDTKNEALVAQIKGHENAETELKEKIEGLEKKAYRAPAGSEQEAKAKAELKSVDKWFRNGMKGMDADEVKYLREDSDTEGGYLAPDDMQNDIIKQITEITPFKSIARVITTSRRAITVPKRTAVPQGGWRGEGTDYNEDQAAYGMIRIPLNDLDVFTVATTDLLTDAAFNIEQEIRGDIAENFGQLEGQAFLTGDSASNMPEGFLTNTDIQDVASEQSAGVLDADDFFTLQGELKSGYNGTFMMNRRTIAKARKLKGSDGQYLFAAGLNSGTPNTIAGDTFLSAIDMPDVAANATPLAYGDFFRGYYIVEGLGLTFLRDPYVLATQGKVRFVASRRVGGKVALAEAIKRLKMKV